MSKLTDYLSTWFISDDEIQMHKDVAASQQAILDQRAQEGKVGWYRYNVLSGEIADGGTMLEKYRDENDNPFAVVPWWIWAALLVGAFWYLGGFIWLKGILARRA